jgi:hypothetical protein
VAVNIGTFVLQAHHRDELVAPGTLTAQATCFLEAAVAAGPNVLVSGAPRPARQRPVVLIRHADQRSLWSGLAAGSRASQ